MAVLGSAFVATSPLTASELRESFEIAVPAPPGPVKIDGRDWLVYELHLTNFGREALSISRVEIRTRTMTLLAFEGDELARRMTLAAVSRADTQPIRPGERAIVYVELPLHTPRVSTLLQHRVRFETADRQAWDVDGGEFTVETRRYAALAPPLRGGPWAAVYAWEWPRGHRRVFYTLDGRARLPGRFAIDWVRKDEDGESVRGDRDVVKNHLGYGADVLAVANARVAAARDGAAESERVSTAGKHALDEAAGNYVALDLGDGRFAIYEHLVPGSIKVATGDRVKRGQVIGALGFTGSSTGPHLHFHVADTPSPLSGEGLPFEIEWNGKRERPGPNALVRFD